MQTPDGNQLNLDALYKICPSCFTESKDKEGNLKRVVDWAKLRALLGDNAVEDAPEVYDFTWVGKRAAQREAAKPINKTLRPCPEESVDWDTTQNLYIEGDNLEVLKLLQNSYMGKVKMIYIDPPYNTGNDFVYHDDFAQSAEEYDEHNQDEEGNRFRKNTDSNGRFHSDWCSMMYSRLMVARSLLREDGVIFISIDDNEVENLKKLCDEVFGESNYIELLKWKRKKQPSFLAKHTAKMMEYVLVFAKNTNKLEKLSIDGTSDNTKKVINISNNVCVRHFNSGVRVKLEGAGTIRSGKYIIKTMEVEYLNDVHYSNGYTTNDVDVRSRFSESQENINRFISDDLLFITSKYGLRRDVSEEEQGKRKSITDLLLSDWGDNQESDSEQSELFGKKFFEYTKPVQLVYNLSKCNFSERNLVLDFFSGSATTAHAVMQLNAEDNGNRKFIMVQLQEETTKDSEAYKAGYKNICEIGKERIRRAGKKIKEEHPEAKDLDVGFRVLKCDESNMKDVYFSPKDLQQGMLDFMEDNIKEDRSDLDLLFDCMLRWGVELSLPMTTTQVDGCTIHNVNDGDLLACFAGTITDKVISAIAAQHPLRIVFRDSSFTSASQKMNLFEQFKQLLSWSDQEVRNNVKVI